MKTKVLLLVLMAFVAGGCYEDKGNYDYRNINEITFTFSPENPGDNPDLYEFKQPAADTLRVTFSPVITQTAGKDEKDLSYQWVIPRKVNKKQVKDTVSTKELTLSFPPKVKTSYQVLFRVTDNTTGVEYYRQLRMNTVIPFIRSWFVLHGQAGDRKVGVIEGPNEESTTRITWDAYQDIYGERRFHNASGLIYSPSEGPDFYTTEILTVLEPDSCFYMHAFNFLVTKKFELMMPVVHPRPKLAYGLTDQMIGGTLIVDVNGKLYHARMHGYYFAAKTTPETADYVIDKIFYSKSHYVTIWDKVHQMFMYYDPDNNSYPDWRVSETEHPDDGGNNAVLTAFNDKLFEKDEWKDNEVVYVGQGNNDFSEDQGATALIKNVKTNHYSIYQIAYQGKTSFVDINKISIGTLNLETDSQIATTFAFKDQLFYSRSGKVYLYNTVNQDEIELYDAGGPITQLKFRLSCDYDTYFGEGENRKLGIVVNRPDGTGEFHELFLNEAGDVSQTLVHKGFGPILDICYSFVNRVIQ